MKTPSPLRILDRGVMKEAKICPVCGRPFTIRKKWKDTFASVIYCSDACRKKKKSGVTI